MGIGLPKDVKKIRQGLLIADCGFRIAEFHAGLIDCVMLMLARNRYFPIGNPKSAIPNR
jgi:hypothetical protein